MLDEARREELTVRERLKEYKVRVQGRRVYMGRLETLPKTRLIVSEAHG